MDPTPHFLTVLAAAVLLAGIFALSYFAVMLLHIVWQLLAPKSAKPSHNRVSPIAARWLKAFHLFSSIGWVGAAMSMAILFHLSGQADNDQAYLMLLRAIKVLDDVLITPSALASVLSGFCLSMLTAWGMARFYWIMAKEALAAWALVIGLVIVRQRIAGMLALALSEGAAALNDPAGAFHGPANVVLGLVQMALLLLLVLLSVIKPWKKTGDGS